MKKVLFLLLLLIPFTIKAASVEIKSVELIEKSEDVAAEEHPTFSGMSINLNLEFTKKDDYALYKIVIHNGTDKEYEIESGDSISSNEYIGYSYTFEGDNKVLKPNEDKIVYLGAKYVNELMPDDFTDTGVFTEKKQVELTLLNEPTKNPNTSVSTYVIAIAIILIVSALVLVLLKNKKVKEIYIVLALLLLIPLTAKAIEKLTIQLETNIVIKPNFVKVKYMYCAFPDFNPYGGLDQIEDIYEVTYYFRKDMSISDGFRNEEFRKLNHGEDVHNWGTSGVVYPIALYSCVNEVENVPYHEGMTDEEMEQHNAYMENFYSCLQEDYDYTDLSPLTPGYYWEEDELLPVFDEETAVYYYNDCVVGT